MEFKLIVRTDEGDIYLNDMCDAYDEDGWHKVQLISVTEDKFLCKFDTHNFYHYSKIRPIIKKKLRGSEQAEKLNDLKLLGWWYKVDSAVKEYTISSIGLEDILVTLNGHHSNTVRIRAPRSNVWIRVDDITEDTGK